jgi:glycosyltransferase involved in cell wall biosynthesis
VPRPRKFVGHLVGPYLLLSADPPILRVCDWVLREKSFGIGQIFEFLAEARAYFLVPLSWTHERRPEAVEELRRWRDAHLRAYPEHRFIHTCNTEAERTLFESKGLDAILFNSNASLDERIFRILPNVPRRFDAVYDARISRFKRHELAAGIASLALISKRVGDQGIEDYEAATQRLLAHAHWFNNPFRPDFRVLSEEEVNHGLNQCRVGLCLSAQEGQMMASIQYLLAGLPVVSTPSLGGRDVFFDDDYALIVEPTPDAVAAGVQALIARNIPAEAIRARTLAKVAEHRERLIGLVNRIYAGCGMARDFRLEWPQVYRNGLLDSNSREDDVIYRIAKARSARCQTSF